MSTLIEKLEREYQKWCELEDKSELCSGKAIDARGRTRGLLSAIEVAKQYSDWIDISVEPIKRTVFDSEAVLAIDVNGYTYNVTLADVVICGEKKREWTECKAKWNGEFWEAVEYICQSEKLVAYKHIPSPPSEVKP